MNCEWKGDGGRKGWNGGRGGMKRISKKKNWKQKRKKKKLATKTRWKKKKKKFAPKPRGEKKNKIKFFATKPMYRTLFSFQNLGNRDFLTPFSFF